MLLAGYLYATAAAMGQPTLNIQILLIPCMRSAAIDSAAAKLFPFISTPLRETNICM
jgi:hypothetical protein